MLSPPRTKSKKVCRYCNKLFFRNPTFSATQWSAARFCSRQCSASSKRKHIDNKSKSEAWRRRQGISAQGTPEWRTRISEATKLAMCRPEVQEKIRQPKGAMTLEQRIVRSDALVGKMPKNMMYNSSNYSNIQRGYYDINGTTIFFRSKWEANYALYLDFLIDHKEIYKWEFEPDTFLFEKIITGTRTYTPDFKVFDFNGGFEYHEVKGYMDSKSKTKLKRMAKYYPDVKLVLIDSAFYTALKKQIGKACGFYE